MKKIISLLLSFILLFCSCSNNSKPFKEDTTSIIIKIYVNENLKDIFNSQTDGIKLGNTEKELHTEFVDSIEESDIFIFESKEYDALKKKLLKIEKDKTDIKTRNLFSSYSQVLQNNELFAYPVAIKPEMLFYNEMIFNSDEVKSVEKMMFKDIGKGRKCLSFDISDISAVSSFYFTGGYNIFESDSDINAGSSVTEYLIRLYSNDKFCNYGIEESLTEFEKENLGAIITSIDNFSKIKAVLKDNFAFQILPTVSLDGNDIRLFSFTTTLFLGINKKTRHPLISMDICNYLSGEETQSKLISEYYVPSNRKLLEKESKNIFLNTVSKQVEHFAELPNKAYDENFIKNFNLFSKELYSGIITKSNMIKKLEEYKKTIRKNNSFTKEKKYDKIITT